MVVAEQRLGGSSILRLGSILIILAAFQFLGCSDTTNVENITNVENVSGFDCAHCHADIEAKWSGSSHGDTQADVAMELAEERSGETPEEVLHGDDPENCIACHGALAVTVGDSLTEEEALAHFFSTENGVFTENTEALDTGEWSHVGCEVCHNVPEHRPSTAPVLSIFDSPTAEYAAVSGASELCGQCHGSLRFDTDHQTYDQWKSSLHSATQKDVADSLAAGYAGQTPYDVLHGENPADCIACHGPTSILANGGMTEEEALGYFFTTEGGKFTANTTVAHTDEWPNVACNACHDQHAPGPLPSFFNSTTGEFEAMASGEALCANCHDRSFSDPDHPLMSGKGKGGAKACGR